MVTSTNVLYFESGNLLFNNLPGTTDVSVANYVDLWTLPHVEVERLYAELGAALPKLAELNWAIFEYEDVTFDLVPGTTDVSVSVGYSSWVLNEAELTRLHKELGDYLN